MAYIVQHEAVFGGGWIDIYAAQSEKDAERYFNGRIKSLGRSHLRIIQKAQR